MKPVKLLLFFFIIAFILTALIPATNAMHNINRYKHGTIALRGLVLSEAGNPIWVEYYSTGKYRQTIGEAIGEYKDASVMSASAYLSTADSLGVTPHSNVFDESGSVLVSKDFKFLAVADYGNAIGLHASYFTSKPGEVDKTLGKDNLYGYDNDKILCKAIYGATMSLSSSPGNVFFSDGDGNYTLKYYVPQCNSFFFKYNFYITAGLLYKDFNPKDDPGFYYVTHEFSEYCSGFSDSFSVSTIGYSNIFGATSVEATLTIDDSDYNFPVDVAMLTGKAIIENAGAIFTKFMGYIIKSRIIFWIKIFI